ncbi:MAG: ATP-binding protein [Bacteroidota bacterium]
MMNNMEGGSTNEVDTQTACSYVPNYKDLVEQNEAGIFYLNNLEVTYANPAFCHMLGYDVQGPFPFSIQDFLSPDDQLKLADIFQKLLLGQVRSISENFRLASEEERYFSLHLRIDQIWSDKEIGIIGSSRESTQRVMAARDLEKTKTRYEALYRHMPDGIIVYDYINEKIIDCNEAAYQNLGFEKKEGLTQLTRFDIIPRYSDFFPGVDLLKLTDDHRQKVENGESFSLRGVLQGTDKHHRICNVNVIPTKTQKGEGYVVFHDATKRVINKLALQKSEQQYRHIFENSHEAIIYIDLKSHQLIDCNSPALALFDFSSKTELLTNKQLESFAEKEIDGMSFSKFYHYQVERAIRLGKTRFSFKGRKKGESYRIIDAVLVADLEEPEKPKGILFCQDTTEIFEAQEALNSKNLELQKYIDSNLQLENFAYFASHDLQTPLRSIISFTQLLQRSLKGKLESNEKEYMEFIVNSGKNMKILINDLLSYSRVNTDEKQVEPFVVQELIQDLEKELSILIKEKNALLLYDKVPFKIKADRTKMRQLLQNLLTNALKFTRPGIQPKVELQFSHQKDYYQLAVRDNGIGIPQKYQHKIFLLFKRLHSNNEYEGTGIGLAMCKKIVEQHHGSIWLDSEENKGTTFYFTIAKEK